MVVFDSMLQREGIFKIQFINTVHFTEAVRWQQDTNIQTRAANDMAAISVYGNAINICPLHMPSALSNILEVGNSEIMCIYLSMPPHFNS